MLAKLSNKLSRSTKKKSHRHNWWMLLVLPAWVAVAYLVANMSVFTVLLGAQALNIPMPANDPVFNTVLAVVLYGLTLAITILVPWKLFPKNSTTKEELGVTRWPNWLDIVLTPAAAIVYLIIAAIVMAIFAALIPSIDLDQAQDVGFDNLSFGYEYVLAFVTLIVLAPIAEELLFRGYLYGKLRKYVPLWAVILVTSALFGLAHGQWNVGLNTFALGIVLASLREVTGSIWAGVLLHMLKNGIAFYFIFVNPSLMTTMGG